MVKVLQRGRTLFAAGSGSPRRPFPESTGMEGDLKFLTAIVLAFAANAAPATELPTSAEVRAHAEKLLAETYPADGPGAAVLVVRGDEVLYRGARGLASVELGVPLSADQSFRIGSVTKQFAAAGLLKLIDAGKVGLDDPLSKFLPDFPNGAKITVRQLLDHTSGIKSYTDIAGVMNGPIRQDLGTAALIATFKDQPVDFTPGESWAYNNSGYVLVGAVIEAASGKPWHVHLAEWVLAPSGLERTVYGADDALIAGMARGYTVRDGHVAPAAYLSMTQPHAAGALVSTVDDLHRWNRSLHGGKLLAVKSYTSMTTPAGRAKDSNYGFGIGRGTLRGHVQLQHGGGIFGFASHLLYVPDAELSVAVLQNADATINGKGDPQHLAALLGAYALGDPYPAAKAVEVGTASLKAAEGVYRVDAQTTRVLRVVDGKLTAQRTGSPQSPLVPTAIDAFHYEGSLTWFKIERDADGKITGMRLYQDGEGEGAVALLTDEPLPSARASISVPVEQLERLVGRYSGNGMNMKVFLEGSQLKTQLDGQPAFDLLAETPSKFFLAVVDATLTFAPETGTAASVTLHQGPAVIEFKRIE
jgi:CubicO group peptidase (beta-lactamase class C family)